MAEDVKTVTLADADWQIMRLALANSELSHRLIMPIQYRLEQQLAPPATEAETPPLVKRMTGGARP